MRNLKFFRHWLVFLSLLVVVLVAGKFFWGYLLSPWEMSNVPSRRFVVFQGESSFKVAKRLETEGFIRSASAFNILVRMSGQAGQIQAGDFQLSSSMGTEEILQQLTSGVVSTWVTLIEGLRKEEMAEELNSKLNLPKSKFLAVAMEGYMFPDTYLFKPDIEVSEVVKVLRDNFEKKLSLELKDKMKNLGLTLEEGVILASIVEREARSDEDRRMVASILLKRYKIGMALNADATVQYALGYQSAEEGWWKRHLTAADLKVDSPYNSYLYAGLPPTPISNPSLSSLQAVAAANPSTAYLYYYHDSKGQAHYGKTLEEHNENVASYP